MPLSWSAMVVSVLLHHPPPSVFNGPCPLLVLPVPASSCPGCSCILVPWLSLCHSLAHVVVLLIPGVFLPLLSWLSWLSCHFHYHCWHPQSTPQAVACGGGCRCWVVSPMVLLASSPSCLCSGPGLLVIICSIHNPPCEQLLTAVGVGAGAPLLACGCR